MSIVCFVVGAAYLLPLLWITMTSTRSLEDSTSNTFFPHTFRLGNYRDAWNQIHIGRLFWHSVLATFFTVVGTVVLSLAAAWGFERFDSRTRRVLFALIVAALMVPGVATLLPFFVTMRQFGLYNHLSGVVIGQIAASIPLGILIFRGYMRQLPRELVDAARVDGAGEFAIFTRIVTPLLRPAIATVAIFVTLAAWNSFLLPLVLIRDPLNSTLPVGLASLLGGFNTDYTVLAAGSVIAIVPILVVLVAARRSYVRGVGAGAIKG